jgi:hypothetical protein
VYGALDLFSSTEQDLIAWAKDLHPDAAPEDLLPDYFSPDNQGVLARHLASAAVITPEGTIDTFNLRGFQRVIELLPHFRAEEAARKPAPRAKVVLTVPPKVRLPDEARHLQRSLAVRVSEALVSADRRVLLASPFWSDAGREILLPSLERALELELPITLAGAKDEVGRDDLSAMLRFGRAIESAGGSVEALRFVPPQSNSIFHAKLVCGRIGYLGSANLTAAGLGAHVEAGLPLEEVDVERVWWLIGVLRDAELLVPEAA